MWERIAVGTKTTVKVGYGMIKIPRVVFDAEFVSVEADKQVLKIRLTPETAQAFNVYSMRHKSYNGISFSRIADYFGMFPQPCMKAVPHKIEDGKLIVDLSGLEKKK